MTIIFDTSYFSLSITCTQTLCTSFSYQTSSLAGMQSITVILKSKFAGDQYVQEREFFLEELKPEYTGCY